MLTKQENFPKSNLGIYGDEDFEYWTNNKTFELNNIEVKKHTSQCLQSDQMQYKAIESISSTILEEGVNDTKVALLYEPL